VSLWADLALGDQRARGWWALLLSLGLLDNLSLIECLIEYSSAFLYAVMAPDTLECVA
jgi:hypothetical protein